MPNGIQRFDAMRGPADDGPWVRFSDVEARLEAADRLAEAAEKAHREWDCDCDSCQALASALAAYRSTRKGEGQ